MLRGSVALTLTLICPSGRAAIASFGRLQLPSPLLTAVYSTPSTVTTMMASLSSTVPESGGVASLVSGVSKVTVGPSRSTISSAVALLLPSVSVTAAWIMSPCSRPASTWIVQWPLSSTSLSPTTSPFTVSVIVLPGSAVPVTTSPLVGSISSASGVSGVLGSLLEPVEPELNATAVIPPKPTKPPIRSDESSAGNNPAASASSSVVNLESVVQEINPSAGDSGIPARQISPSKS